MSERSLPPPLLSAMAFEGAEALPPRSSAGPAPVLRVGAEGAGRLPARRRRSNDGRYATVWAAAGLVAVAYTAAVVVGQEPLTSIAARWSSQERDAGEVAAALARTQTEVAQLQKTVGALETDMTRVKAQGIQADSREKELTSRVAGVEGRVERFATQLLQVTAKAPPPPAPAAKGASPSQVALRPGATPIETAALPPPEAPAVARERAAARHTPQPVEQSIAVPPPAAVLLARAPSIDALRLSWSLLSDRHKVALNTLEPRVVSTEPGIYQLVAGPIASPADAAKVCATLKTRGVSCQPSDFRGDGL